MKRPVILGMSPAEQQQYVVDLLRQAGERVQNPTPEVVGGMLAFDPAINKVGEMLGRRQADTTTDRALAGSLGSWAQGRQSNTEMTARQEASYARALQRAMAIQGVSHKNAMERAATQFGYQKELAELAARNREKLAQIKANAKDGASAKPLTSAEQTSIREGVEIYNALSDSLEGFKDNYAGDVVPGQTTLQNLASRTGGFRQLAEKFSGEDIGEQANWWRLYKRMSELKERHALFGATLTKGENISWQQAEISPGMDPKDVRKNLQIRLNIIKKKLAELSGGIALNRNNPGVVSKLLGDKLSKELMPNELNDELRKAAEDPLVIPINRASNDSITLEEAQNKGLSEDEINILREAGLINE